MDDDNIGQANDAGDAYTDPRVRDQYKAPSKDQNVQVSQADENAKLNLLRLSNLEMADEEQRNRCNEKVCQGAVHRRQNIHQSLVDRTRELPLGDRIEGITLPVSGWRQTSKKVEHDKHGAGDDNVDN